MRGARPGRWRPSLAFVLGGALSGTLALSFLGLVLLRYLGPEWGFRATAIALALVIGLLTAGLGWLLTRLLLRPVRALEAYATAIEAAEAPAVAPPRHFGTRELHRTAQRVIGMAEALRDREATIRSYTDHVTHELKTPVSAIRAAVELLGDGPDQSAENRQLLATIDGARAQIEAQLAALRDAARAREARYLGQSCLADLMPALQQDFPALTFAVSGKTQTIPLAKDGLRIVLQHLAANAADHGASHISITATSDARSVRLDVTDNGSGISPGNAPHVFDPFFTTRRDDGGTGMGLTILRNLLTAHRGRIEHLPGATGARFQISLDLGMA